MSYLFSNFSLSKLTVTTQWDGRGRRMGAGDHVIYHCSLDHSPGTLLGHYDLVLICVFCSDFRWCRRAMGRRRLQLCPAATSAYAQIVRHRFACTHLVLTFRSAFTPCPLSLAYVFRQVLASVPPFVSTLFLPLIS